MLIDGKEILITATIGIALHPSDVEDLDGLLRTADAAMCDAKDHVRNTHRFYSPELARMVLDHRGSLNGAALLAPRK